MSTPWKDPFEGFEFQPLDINAATNRIMYLFQDVIRKLEQENDVCLRVWPMKPGEDLRSQVSETIKAYDVMRTEILKYYRQELASRPPHPILVKMPARFQICKTCHKPHMNCDCTVEYPGGGNKIL